jgi:hypothetical protein
MNSFGKKLDESTSLIQEKVQEEKSTADREKQTQLALQNTLEERTICTHSVAVRFNEKSVEPLMDQIRTKIPGGMGREFTDRKHGFAGWELQFDAKEFLALKVFYNDRGLWLAAEAACRTKGVVYSKRSRVFDSARFDEKEAQDWIEAHALEAYEAFGQNAFAVRNPQPIVTYNGIEPG